MKNVTKTEKLNVIIDEMYAKILEELKENYDIWSKFFPVSGHLIDYKFENSDLHGKFETMQIKDNDLIFNFEYCSNKTRKEKHDFKYDDLKQIMSDGEMYDMLNHILQTM